MDEMDEVLDSNTHKEEGSEKQEAAKTEEKVYSINNRTYTQAQIDEMAKDYDNLTRQTGKLASELGELKKKVEEPKQEKTTTTELSPEERQVLRETLKKEGFLTKEEVEQKEYAREADRKLTEISEKYGISKDDFGKELIDLGYRIPVEKFESYYKANHADEYLTWKEKQKEQDRMKTPYTNRSQSEGVDLPQGNRVRFGDGSVADRSLELIGRK